LFFVSKHKKKNPNFDQFQYGVSKMPIHIYGILLQLARSRIAFKRRKKRAGDYKGWKEIRH